MLFELPPAAQELQSVARRLAETAIAPRAAEVDRAEAYPWDNVAALREAGLLGYTIPREYGGAGGSFLDAVLGDRGDGKRMRRHRRGSSSRPIWAPSAVM